MDEGEGEVGREERERGGGERVGTEKVCLRCTLNQCTVSFLQWFAFM